MFPSTGAASSVLDQVHLLPDCREWLDEDSHGCPSSTKLVPVPDGGADVAQSQAVIVSRSDLYPLQEIEGLGAQVTSAE